MGQVQFVLPHIYPSVQYEVYIQEPQLTVEPLSGLNLLCDAELLKSDVMAFACLFACFQVCTFFFFILPVDMNFFRQLHLQKYFHDSLAVLKIELHS